MRWNEKFKDFVKKTEEGLRQHPETLGLKFEFDIPYRELAFSGVPSKSTCDIMPTVHALVALDETPPMVVSLDDVEIANFERVNFNLRNFDLVFVFKDFRRPVQRIDAIPSKSLDQIKKWLNSCNIVYYETPHNLVWKKLLRDIGADANALEDFYRKGGWENLVRDVAGQLEQKEDGGAAGEDGEGS